MRNIIFVAPFLMETTLRFVDGARGLQNVRILGITTKKPGGPTPRERARFHELYEVNDCFDPAQLEEAARFYMKQFGPVFRVLNILEHIQEVVAELRARIGVQGLQPEVARRFLHKGAMKAMMQQQGIPCARHAVLRSIPEGEEFIRATGFPVILKPPVGAGCKSTYRISNAAEFAAAMREIQPSPQNPIQAEEFITGTEHSFDTVTVGGRPLFYSISHYITKPLEAIETPECLYYYVLPRDYSGPEFDDIKRVGLETVVKLGMESGMTHCEWFRRENGTSAIGEIAARPPGAQITRAMCYAHDADFYRIWARAGVDEAFDGVPERKYAVGVVFFKGPGNGRVVRVEGADEANAKIGKYVIEAKLPQVGEPKGDGYEGNGFAIIRDPDTKTAYEVIEYLAHKVKTFYG